MDKFRKRALHWLSLKSIGAYFQVFGFNMCCVSVLNFVSQLYVLPDEYAKFCKQMALRFMHGPRFWLHGEDGHVAFRANDELGLKASPRCPQAASLALCFQGCCKHQADYERRIADLKRVGYGCEHLPFAQWSQRREQCDELIQKSPAWHSKTVHELGKEYGYNDLCARAPIHIKVSNLAYSMFLDRLHPPGVVYYKLETIYQKRWCPSVLPGGNPQFLAYTACRNLKWLSMQVPSRVHLANVRLHFNGWHTDCRYQRRDSLCRFCEGAGTEDRVEHFLECDFVHNCFPAHWKPGSTSHIPVERFFLLRMPEEDMIVMSVFNYALYTICNEIRHCNIHPELKQALWRTMGGIYLKPRAKQAWLRIFGPPGGVT